MFGYNGGLITTSSWVHSPCRSWLLAAVSEDLIASVSRAKVRKFRKLVFYIGSSNESLSVKARDDEEGNAATSGPMGKSPLGLKECWTGEK
jgi:hypothetical protein